MPIKTHFVLKGLQRVRIDEYLENELKRAGYGGVDIQKTPLGTRLTVYAARPGFVIGRRGKTVRDLTEALKQKFGIDNPQIEVAEVEVPEFDANIMAQKLASSLERGFHYRRAVYSVMRRMMEAGAKGVEITISGKLTSQRARYQKFRDGVITKSGDPVRQFVREATAPASLKPGVMGVRVVLMLPGELPDKIRISYPEIAPKAPQPEAQKMSEEAVVTPAVTAEKPSETTVVTGQPQQLAQEDKKEPESVAVTAQEPVKENEPSEPQKQTEKRTEKKAEKKKAEKKTGRRKKE
ncbi:MAG: 30S ribosomal protein S3 [Candidatus Atabeyarchaeum deiterrae]